MLSDRLAAYLFYFERLATQPVNRWEGFYLTQREEMNFGLRFQIAFSCYALGALCRNATADPTEQERCRVAMAALIERMLQRRVWAYWAIEADRRGLAADPISEANLHYSGHLAMMIGVFEISGGDQRYDDSFTLLWGGRERYTYTHSTLVEALVNQMRSSHSSAIDCTAGRTTVAAMNHALWANLFHDGLHGSDYATVNDDWLVLLEKRLVLRGPGFPRRGAFSAYCKTRSRRGSHLSMNLVDAWGLAFLTSLAPDLARRVAPRFLCRIRSATAAPDTARQAYVPSEGRLQEKEVSDVAINTGFGYLLAVELDDADLASALSNYAEANLDLVESDDERYYSGGLAAPYTTALFALGEAGGLRTLHQAANQDSLKDTTTT
ncbi:MAG: hypothetical protein MI924_08355 [Chloroflexales bacterium]|nr:hypothetical protein [Chloroflexales bacterium]